MRSLFETWEQIGMYERRLEQYVAAYQRYTDKLTHLLFIYSAVAIFLMPITLDLFKSGREAHWVYYASYFVLLGMLVVSMFYAGKLILPRESVLPVPLQKYSRIRWELKVAGMSEMEIEQILQNTYLTDMMELLDKTGLMVKRKEGFYEQMFYWGLAAVFPYIICLIFHLRYEFAT